LVIARTTTLSLGTYRGGLDHENRAKKSTGRCLPCSILVHSVMKLKKILSKNEKESIYSISIYSTIEQMKSGYYMNTGTQIASVAVMEERVIISGLFLVKILIYPHHSSSESSTERGQGFSTFYSPPRDITADKT